MPKIVIGDYGRIVLVGHRVIGIERGATTQGFVYKNTKAYEDKQGVCYIPELRDETYTYDDFISIANGDEKVARELFDTVDWQSPELLMDEWEDPWWLNGGKDQ